MERHWWRYWRSKDYVAKRRVEQCITLSLSWMLQNNYLELGMGQVEHHAVVWRNYENGPVYALTVDLERVSPNGMRLYLRNTDQVVQMDATGCRFGGERWWFCCPRCRRRCTKLYLPRDSVFLCRICHNLTYESCIEGKSTTALMAEMAAQLGLSLEEVKEDIALDGRTHNKWTRKRGRRANHRAGGGLQDSHEKSLKRRMLEAKAMNELAKVLGSSR